MDSEETGSAGLTDAHRRALEASLEQALDESTEPDVRFHIRHALQLVSG